MSAPLVYLCGPITGASYEEARFGWRRIMAAILAESGIDCLSPMRMKQRLAHETSLAASGYTGNPLSCPRGIVARDRYDTQRCGMVVCNLLGADRVSIGSMIELGWCDSMRIPLVLVMEREGNPHEHAMVRELADFCVETVEEAAEIVRAVLLPGV